MSAKSGNVGAPCLEFNGCGGAVELQARDDEVLHEIDARFAPDRLDDLGWLMGVAVERRVSPDRARVGLGAAEAMKSSPGDRQTRLVELLVELLVVPGHRPKLYPAKTAAW